MTDPVNLEMRRGGKKDPCPYCGEPEHVTPLACPRIKVLTIYAENDCMEIEFRDEWEPPKLAG